MISIRSNRVSLSAQRQLDRTMVGLRDNTMKLASGYRINKAADDAAGLAISEKMKADILSFAQARRNTNDGISLVQTAESGMSDITGMLQRLRELAMQAASDGVTDTERAYINTEAGEIQSEIDRISADTEFNGVALLDGTLSADFQIGLDAGDILNVAIAALDTATLGVDGGSVDLSSKAAATSSLSAVDGALDDINSHRAGLGAFGNRFTVVLNNLGAMHEAISAAHSRIRDTDVAQASASMTHSQILMQAGSAMLAQANQIPQVALSLLGG